MRVWPVNVYQEVGVPTVLVYRSAVPKAVRLEDAPYFGRRWHGWVGFEVLLREHTILDVHILVEVIVVIELTSKRLLELGEVRYNPADPIQEGLESRILWRLDDNLKIKPSADEADSASPLPPPPSQRTQDWICKLLQEHARWS